MRRHRRPPELHRQNFRLGLRLQRPQSQNRIPLQRRRQPDRAAVLAQPGDTSLDIRVPPHHKVNKE